MTVFIRQRGALRHIAVERHLGRYRRAVAHSPAILETLFEQFDSGCKSLPVLPDLNARRCEARRLMVELVELDAAMRADARERREDDLRADLRCDQHFRLAMRNFEVTREWTLDQCWAVPGGRSGGMTDEQKNLAAELDRLSADAARLADRLRRSTVDYAMDIRREPMFLTVASG